MKRNAWSLLVSTYHLICSHFLSKFLIFLSGLQVLFVYKLCPVSCVFPKESGEGACKRSQPLWNWVGKHCLKWSLCLAVLELVLMNFMCIYKYFLVLLFGQEGFLIPKYNSFPPTSNNVTNVHSTFIQNAYILRRCNIDLKSDYIRLLPNSKFL